MMHIMLVRRYASSRDQHDPAAIGGTIVALHPWKPPAVMKAVHPCISHAIITSDQDSIGGT